MDFKTIRKEYADKPLVVENLLQNPIAQFEKWMQEAIHAGIEEPNAMALATISAKGGPSVRTVLLKNFDPEGFVFHTNYNSAKAREMENDSRVALMFFWSQLERQIRINGTASKISREESERYFRERPLRAQLSAWASPQSEVIANKEELEKKIQTFKEQFSKKKEIPLPPFWGGYRIKPESFEFWQGRPDRLHDRFVYQRGGNSSWIIHRLAP